MKIVSIYKQMFAALQDGGIEAVSKAAFNIMKMPITISDASYTIIGMHPQTVTGDEQWDTNQLNRQVIPEAILAFQNDEHWKALQQAEGGMCIDWGYFKGRPRYCALLEKNGKLLGSIAFLIGNVPMESWHLEAVNIIAKTASIAMERDYSTHRNAVVLKEVLMKSLVMGNAGSQAQFLRMAEIVGFTLHSEYVFVGVIQRNTLNEMFSDYIGTELVRCFPDSLEMRQKDCFYMLMNGHDIRAKEQVFRKIANKLKAAENIAVAFSNVFRDPLTLTQYKWQVDRLLEISAQIHEKETIFQYADFVTEIAMVFISRNISEENLLHPMLKKLKDYDKEHETDYLNTLKCFVQSSYNKNDTAGVLNIHRNTLFYRLEKISEVTGVYIRDPKTANHLILSFCYMDIAAKRKN